MLFSVGNKILKGGFGFLSVSPDSDIILNFEVQGTCFPAKRTQGIGNTAYLRLDSLPNETNKVFIDYNDGTGEHEYNFKSSGSNRQIWFRNLGGATTPETIQGSNWYDETVHFYQDLPEGVKNTVDETYPQKRTISIRFEKPQSIIRFHYQQSLVFGQFPSEISKLRNLDILMLVQLQNVDTFAQDFYSSNIRNLTFENVGNVMNNGLPLWILNSVFLQSMNIASSADLSGDPVTKRLSEIDKVKDTLKYLNLFSTGLNYVLPEAVGNLLNLEEFILQNNTSANLRMPVDLSGLESLFSLDVQNTRMPFSEIERTVQGVGSLKNLNIQSCQYNVDYDFSENNTTLEQILIGGNNTWNSGAVPSFINKLIGLKELTVSNSGSTTVSSVQSQYGDFSNCEELETLNIYRLSNFTTSIPAWFSSLVSLKNMNVYASFQNSGGINSFVDNFYNFVIAEASMVVANTAFRNMIIDSYGTNTTDRNNSTRPTGTYQEPSGYVQGSDNGTPASQMEKIWVLVNQYGHTWTVKP